MKEEAVLKMAQPHIRGHMLRYDDFDKIFGKILSKRRQYQVTDILSMHGIELVDEFPSEVVEKEIVEEKEGRFTENLDGMMKEEATDVESDRDWFDDETVLGLDDRPIDKDTVLEKDWHLPISPLPNEMLCQLLQEGNPQAKQDLVVKNRGLVLKCAGYYSESPWCHLTHDDLEQVGLQGLLKAAKRFDSSRGTAFSTYAVWWIKQCMTRAMMDEGDMIRVPVHMQEFIRKVTRMDEEFARDGIVEQEMRWQKIATTLDAPFQKIQEAFAVRDKFLRYTSLDVPVGEESDMTLGDLLEDRNMPSVEEQMLRMSEAAIIQEILGDLKKRERQVLALRYGLVDGVCWTLEQIGQLMGVTRERIRQIEGKALRKFRARLRISGHYKDLREAYDEHPDAHRRKNRSASKRA